MDCQNAFCHIGVGPHAGEQLIFREEAARLADERDQDIEGLRCEVHQLITFMRKIVMLSADEVAAMKARPSWAGLLATVETSARQDRALSMRIVDVFM